MPTVLISPGPVTPILQNIVYALPASPCIVTGGVTLQRATASGGPFTDWVGSAAGIYHGGSIVQSHVKCATGNTTIQAVKIKMNGMFSKSAYSGVVAASGPSNYWQLNETSGLVAKDLIGGVNGTISGGVTLNQPGAIVGNTAMTFDGVTGKIATTPVTLPVTVTLEGWIKTSAGGYQTVVSNRAVGVDVGTISLGIDTGGAMAVSDHVTSHIGVRYVNDGVWHHLMAVLTGTQLSMYVDGVLDKAIAFNHATSTQPAAIAVDNRFASAFNGTIDDVSIYPRALSPTEISAHYAAR